MTDKKQELKARFDIEISQFVNSIRDEVIKSTGKELPKWLAEYIYANMEPVLDNIADELVEKAESWLKRKLRKIKMWARRRF